MPHDEQNSLTHTTSPIPDGIKGWVNEFYKAKRVEGLSAHTVVFYAQQLGHFLKFCETVYTPPLERITSISPASIRNYLIWLEVDERHNPGGIHAAYRSLKSFLKWFEREAEPPGWKNPIGKIKAPKLPEEPLDPVSLADVDRMTRTCGPDFYGLRDKALLLFLLDTGARAAEVCACNLADVDQVTGAILIRAGKGRKPRFVYIQKKAKRAFRAYLKARIDLDPAAWINDEGRRLSYGGLRAVIVRRAELANIPAPSPHDFRRAFAINMLRNGVDLVTLARLMGHTSTAVLWRYLKQVPADLERAHQKGSPVEHMKGGDFIDYS